MHNIDPNDMDALFREGAEKHEFTYNPDAWAMMEDKLDTRKRRRYFFLWFFLGAILIAGIAGIYLFTNSNEQPNSISTNSNIEIASKLETIESDLDKEVKTTIELADQNINSSELVSRSNDNQVENNKTIIKALDDKSELKEEYINTNSKVISSYIGAQNSFQSENTGSLVENEVVSVSSPALDLITNEGRAINSSEENIKNLNIVNDKTANHVPSIQDSRGLLTLDILNGKKSVSIIQNNKTEYVFDLQPTPYAGTMIASSASRYVFTAFGSSDFSSVGFFSDSQSGFTLGGKVGVQLARKFQLDLGFAYSLKRYGSEGLDYNMAGGWNEMVGINPTRMEGKGNILQIPIEATYYISGYENNSFFINAGVSSFLLNSEWYGFKYDPADLLNNPDAPEEITMADIPRRNFHLAGVARVSVGYQRILSPNMAFEISPYLQIPLTGIGEGKVDLYTAGVQFAVKFNTK